MKHTLFLLPLFLMACSSLPVVRTHQGKVQGTVVNNVYAYLGIPYAQPPVGELRWREPLPPAPYDTVLIADHFRGDPLQHYFYSDMVFRGTSFSEDCLYLNIWTPAQQHTSDNLHPVLIYFNGGGWMGGSGSEPRYDGAALANKGIIVVTANYREGIFGFFAHPELTTRSPLRTSGQQGLLDQAAAIQWVHTNIASFGGDPARITIAGESAGSFSVSTLMTSPLVKELLFACVGSSGAEVAPYNAISLTEAEQRGEKLLALKNLTIDRLLAMDADSIFAIIPPMGMASAVVDNYLLTETPDEAFRNHHQAPVPLLAGWNSKEASPVWYLDGDYTLAALRRYVMPRLGSYTDEVLAAYGIQSDADVLSQAGVDLCSDLFTAYATWRWCDLHQQAGYPVYRYLFSQPRPAETDGLTPDGAVHSADIEFAMGNLYLNKVFHWTEEDKKVSEQFSDTYVHFVSTGTVPENWYPGQSSVPNERYHLLGNALR